MMKKVFLVFWMLSLLSSMVTVKALGLKSANENKVVNAYYVNSVPLSESNAPTMDSGEKDSHQQNSKSLSKSQKKKDRKIRRIFKKFTADNAHWANIVSLCTGILGFLVSFLGWGLLLSIAALVFGIIGVSGDKGGKGMGIAGIVLGSLGFIISIIMLIVLIALL